MSVDRWDEKTNFCCRNCRFYSPKANDLGRCRRNAPTMGGFPVVFAEDDWCGEHKLGTNPHKERLDEAAKVHAGL